MNNNDEAIKNLTPEQKREVVDSLIKSTLRSTFLGSLPEIQITTLVNKIEEVYLGKKIA